MGIKFDIDLMAVKKGQTIELAIDQIAFGGKGLCRVDGMAVFVDQAVPGDRLAVRIDKKKKSYAEARVLELIAPSSFRVCARRRAPTAGYAAGASGSFWTMNGNSSISAGTFRRRWSISD